MKENLTIFLITLFLAWLFPLSIIEAQLDNDVCNIFPDGTKLRRPDDCSQEIICKNFQSTNGIKCSDPTPFYNKETHKCEKNLTDDSRCAIDCTWWEGEFVADPKSCYGYYYCVTEESAIWGYCGNNLHFNQDRQACVDTGISDCETAKLNYCSIVSTGVKFKDEDYCGRYYECVFNKTTEEVKLQNQFCPTSALYFNAAKGACQTQPSSSSPCKPVPKNICLVGAVIRKNYFVSDGRTCQGSYFCKDIGDMPDPDPTFNQCPGNKFFNQAKQKCMDPKDVVCLKDRCQGSTRTFVISSKAGCRHYIRCENGRTVREETCGNLFFDEERAYCTPELVNYPACYHK